MRRRDFITLIGASVAWPFAAVAQEPGRTYRLGCLFTARGNDPAYMAFFNELRRGGFIEGQNLKVEYRVYGQHADLIPQYAAELFYLNRRLIIERTVAAHLPTIWELIEIAEEGGFAAYGPRVSALLETMAQQIVKLLRGVKVADIPVEQATKFELVINLKAARAMGIAVPESLLVRADKVIE